MWFSGWWFQIFFYFQPYLGKIPILTNIFQRGLKPPNSFHWLVKTCLIEILFPPLIFTMGWIYPSHPGHPTPRTITSLIGNPCKPSWLPLVSCWGWDSFKVKDAVEQGNRALSKSLENAVKVTWFFWRLKISTSSILKNICFLGLWPERITSFHVKVLFCDLEAA